MDCGEALLNSSYYGFGYYWIYFVLFRLNFSAEIIYLIISMGNAVLRVMIIPIAYHMMDRYFAVEDSLYKYLLAFLSAFIVSTDIAMISNEAMLNTLVWIVLLVVCKVVEHKENKGKHVFYSFLLVSILVYGLTIHTRWQTIIIAVIITGVLLAIVYKVKIISWMVALVGFILWVSVNWGIELYQNVVWNSTSITNTGVTIANEIDIMNGNTWDLWLRMIVGMLMTKSFVTAGIIIITVITIVGYIIDGIRRKNNNENNNIYIFMVIAITILCIGATICAFLVSSWFKGMIEPFSIGDYSEIISSYKGITYIRYWEIYASPLIVVALCILQKYNVWKKIL